MHVGQQPAFGWECSNSLADNLGRLGSLGLQVDLHKGPVSLLCTLLLFSTVPCSRHTQHERREHCNLTHNSNKLAETGASQS